jgi:MFS family permease
MFGFTTLSITAIYAVFAGGGMAGLLIFGRASDYVGRRRVVAVSIGIQLIGLALLVAASSELLLYLGRIVDGAGVGIGVGALSAWLVDLQPPANPRLGGLISGGAVMLGLGVGAFGSGLLVELGPDPTHLVYWVLGGLYVFGLAGILLVPDVSVRRPGWLGSLAPKVGVPRGARPLFLAYLPSLIGVWALGGLFLALGPTLAISLLGQPSPAYGGLVIMLLLGTGAVTSVLMRDREAASLVAGGSGRLHASKGELDEAIRILTEAAAAEEATPPPPGPPPGIKPAHELLGEVLLQADRPEEAVEAFEISLERHRDRGRALLGLARAAVRLGDRERAASAYERFARQWSEAGSDSPELRERSESGG